VSVESRLLDWRKRAGAANPDALELDGDGSRTSRGVDDDEGGDEDSDEGNGNKDDDEDYEEDQMDYLLGRENGARDDDDIDIDEYVPGDDSI